MKHLPSEELLEKAQTLLSALECEDRELSLLITDDKEIAALNLEYRKKDRATDVLSFPMDLEDKSVDPESGANIFSAFPLLGDVVISLETACRQAAELEVSVEEEIIRLLIHGVLHLLGYDHENVSEEEAARMVAKEEFLISRLKLPGRGLH